MTPKEQFKHQYGLMRSNLRTLRRHVGLSKGSLACAQWATLPTNHTYKMMCAFQSARARWFPGDVLKDREERIGWAHEWSEEALSIIRETHHQLMAESLTAEGDDYRRLP